MSVYCLAIASYRLLLKVSIVGLATISLALGDTLLEDGRKIYEEGILPDGKPLTGIIYDGAEVSGQAAACMNCHRKSGMGGAEGSTVISPITGKFLFKRDEHPMAIVDARHRMGFNMPHDSFTKKTLENAIEQGKGITGEPLNLSMPRYTMGAPGREALLAYLEQLSGALSPGVDADSIHFATIMTPDVDKNIHQVVIDSMSAYFTQRNASWQDGIRHHRIGFDVYPRTPRKWVLHVWELQGEPRLWQEQLKNFYNDNPVFAVISGVSLVPAQPIHAFCAQEKIPCLFRTANLVPELETRYDFYFSKGLLLEAGILVSHLRSMPDSRKKRLVQIARDNETGRTVTDALARDVKSHVASMETRLITDNKLSSLRKALEKVSENDIVMIWLDTGDLTHFTNGLPLPKAQIYMSTLLGGGEHSLLPENWKNRVSFVYPYELTDTRVNNLADMYAWVTTNHIPAVSERIQSEVFFNLFLLSELTAQMLDNLYREYLIEKVEDILSSGFNHSIYPSLSLGPGQRFASRGGYIVKISQGKAVAESERIVP